MRLVPVGHRQDAWACADEVVRAAIGELDVAVARGLSHCPPAVSAGARTVVGESENDVLVFACPADVGIFEAAPLVGATESGVMLPEVAAFFGRASEAALTLAERIAWVVAHDWSPGCRPRWDSGDVDRLVRFATSPGAWRTPFVGTRPREVFESDEWPYWFEVTRAQAETNGEWARIERERPTRETTEGPLAALQEWYAARCDGDWEHSSGIRIESLDDPGWILRIDLAGTGLEREPFAPIRTRIHQPPGSPPAAIVGAVQVSADHRRGARVPRARPRERVEDALDQLTDDGLGQRLEVGPGRAARSGTSHGPAQDRSPARFTSRGDRGMLVRTVAAERGMRETLDRCGVA